MRHLLDLDEELLGWFAERGYPAYRLGQIHQWLFEKRANGFDEMTNVSKKLQRELSEEFHWCYKYLVNRFQA